MQADGLAWFWRQGDEAGANGKRVIYRQRLTNEQVGQLTQVGQANHTAAQLTLWEPLHRIHIDMGVAVLQIAEAAEWSLLRIPRAQREALSTQVRLVAVEQGQGGVSVRRAVSPPTCASRALSG